MRTDVYQRITDQIVNELEKGVRPWFMPWNCEGSDMSIGPDIGVANAFAAGADRHPKAGANAGAALAFVPARQRYI